MQHTVTATEFADAIPERDERRQEWWAFGEGVKAFPAARTDEAFLAFAAAAKSRASDYALGVRLERADRGLRLVGYWEEPAFLRRVMIERDLGPIEPGLAGEIMDELKPDTPIAARLAAFEFAESGEPVNLIIDVLAAR